MGSRTRRGITARWQSPRALWAKPTRSTLSDRLGFAPYRRRYNPHRQDHQAQALHLQGFLQLERGVIVQEAADEALQFGPENEFAGEEHRLREFLGNVQA